MPYEIEHGVPLPRHGSRQKYPFPDMRSGDSFVFSEEDLGRVRAAAVYWSDHHPEAGVKFSCRKYEDGTYRCFCIDN